MGASNDGEDEIMCEVPQSMVADQTLGHAAFRVLTVLYAMCPWKHASDPFVYPTIATLSQRSGMCNSSVHAALQILKQKGHVRRGHRGGRLGFFLTPCAQKDGAQTHRFSMPAPDTQSGTLEENVQDPGGESPGTRRFPESEPNSKPPGTRTPYIIGTQLINTPPTPQGGTVAVDEPDADEEQSAPVAQLELVPGPMAKVKAKTKPPRARASGGMPNGVDRAEVEAVFEALQLSRAGLAESSGERLTTIGLVARENQIGRAIRDFGVDVVVESITNRGKQGGPTALSILSHRNVPFRPDQIKLGLDLDELKKMAERDKPDGETVVFSEAVDVKL